MYKLALRLPFGIVLVHRIEFENEQAAKLQAIKLPPGFVVVDSAERIDETVILIPLKVPQVP